MKPYGHKIGADSNWGVGKQKNAIKGRARAESKDEVKGALRDIFVYLVENCRCTFHLYHANTHSPISLRDSSKCKIHKS